MVRATAVKGARILSCAAALALASWSMAFAPLGDALSAKKTDASPILLRPSLDAAQTSAIAVAVTEPTVGDGPDRWVPLIAEASERFGVPKAWIRAVMTRESGGRTAGDGGAPLTSRAGAMGLMQLMPETYDDLRRQFALGSDPYDPHDNILAGTAYLKWLKERYGYPGLFAAYNHGPGNFERHLQTGVALPRETQDYVAAVTLGLDTRTKAPRKVRHRRPATTGLRLTSMET